MARELLSDCYRDAVFIDRGSAGALFRAVRVQDGAVVAVTALDPDRLGAARCEALVRAHTLAAALVHPRLLACGPAVYEPDAVLLEAEWCPDGALTGLLRRQRRAGPLPEERIWEIVAQLAEALAFLHSPLKAQGVLAHGCVAPGAVLLAGPRAKLGDCMRAPAAPGPYTAPEVARGGPPSPPADVWALGCLLVELCTLRAPCWSPATLAADPCIALDRCSDALRAAAAACLCADPARRITAAALATFPPALWALHRVEQAAPSLVPRVQLSPLLLKFGTGSMSYTSLQRLNQYDQAFLAITQNDLQLLKDAVQPINDTALLTQLLVDACEKKAYRVLSYLCEAVDALKASIVLSWWKGNPVSRKTMPMLAVEACSLEMIERNIDSLHAVYEDCTALMLAAKDGNLHCLTHLLCELGISSSTGKTALMHAAENGYVDCMSLLLPEVGKQDENGMTAYSYAVMNGHTHCIAVLSRYKAETAPFGIATKNILSSSDEKGSSGHYITDFPTTTTLRATSDTRLDGSVYEQTFSLIDPNQQKMPPGKNARANQVTSAMLASDLDDPIATVLSPTKSSEYRQARLVKSDTVTQVQEALRDFRDESVKPLVAVRAASQTINLLQKRPSSTSQRRTSRPGSRSHSKNKNTLEYAILHNNTSSAVLYLHEFAKEPQTYLDLVFSAKKFKVLPTLCRYIAKKGLNAVVYSKVATPVEELTSLMRAVMKGDAWGVKNNMREVENEYSGWVSYTDDSGKGYILNNCTALMIAAAKGDVECTKSLLCEMGVHLSSKYSALTYAVLGGHNECVRLLLPESALSGYTMLMRCSSFNTYNEIPKHLNEVGATMGPGWTALMIAAQLGHAESVEALVEHEGGKKDKDGNTALYLAASNNQANSIKHLLKKESKMTTNVGWTALMIAAQKGYADCVKMLLKAEGGYQKSDGWTALMLAAQAGHADCVALLLPKEGGMKKQDGWSALMIAAQEGHEKCVLALREKEAKLVDGDGLTALDHVSQQHLKGADKEKLEKLVLCASHLREVGQLESA